MRDQAVALLQTFPLYEENKAYYDSAFDDLHDLAFDQPYKPGGRRTSANFDEERYRTILVGLYHRKANEDGKVDLVKSLDAYRQHHGLPIVEFQ